MRAVTPFPGLNQGRRFQIIKQFRNFFPPGWGINNYSSLKVVYYSVGKKLKLAFVVVGIERLKPTNGVSLGNLGQT